MRSIPGRKYKKALKKFAKVVAELAKEDFELNGYVVDPDYTWDPVVDEYAGGVHTDLNKLLQKKICG